MWRRSEPLDSEPEYLPQSGHRVLMVHLSTTPHRMSRASSSYLLTWLRNASGYGFEDIRPGFPDCIAYRGQARIRIEFEYKSRNFKSQGHNPRDCDWIVCWIHNWPACPPHLRVVELRREYGLGFNVWVAPVKGEYGATLASIRHDNAWSTPSEASEDDIILYYRVRPEAWIQDVFRVAGPVVYKKAGWKPGMDWLAPIRRVATLKAPIYLEELKSHPILATAGFVRASLRGRYRVTVHWPELYAMILERNPGLKLSLKRFAPERLA
jgi:hypothetical protein